jgi:hypothetical protein
MDWNKNKVENDSNLIESFEETVVDVQEFFSQDRCELKDNEAFVKEVKTLSRKVFYIVIIVVEFVTLCVGTWYGSAVFLVDLAKNAVEKGNLESAGRYLSYGCPFGYEIDSVNELKENIDKTKKTIEDIKKELKVNDYIPAINNSKMLVDLWNEKYQPAIDLYNEASEKTGRWLEELYKNNRFDDMVKAVDKLSLEVWNDSSNSKLSDFKYVYAEKAEKLLSSAIKYYNNHEPEKAEKNLLAVNTIGGENDKVKKLQEKLRIFNKSKKYIDMAQKSLKKGDYDLALESYNKADNYTKTVYSDLRAEIVQTKEAKELDERFGDYVGTYVGITDYDYTDELKISKISDGKIWLSGKFGNNGLNYSYSSSGISIKGNSVVITGVSSSGNKTINSIESFTFGDGFMVHKHISSNGEKTYLMYKKQ